jgi:hypothetical protein
MKKTALIRFLVLQHRFEIVLREDFIVRIRDVHGGGGAVAVGFVKLPSRCGAAAVVSLKICRGSG